MKKNRRRFGIATLVAAVIGLVLASPALAYANYIAVGYSPLATSWRITAYRSANLSTQPDIYYASATLDDKSASVSYHVNAVRTIQFKKPGGAIACSFRDNMVISKYSAHTCQANGITYVHVIIDVAGDGAGARSGNVTATQ